MALGVVAVVSGLYLGRLTQQVLLQADDRARFVAQQVFLACRNAFSDAAEHGQSPASANPQDLRNYVQSTLDGSSTLNSLIESAVGYSPTIYEITISDSEGNVMVSSDATLRGQKVATRPTVASLVQSGFIREIRTLYGPQQTFEYSLPFNLGSGPFGDIRIGLSSALLRDEISPQLVSAGYWALGSVLLSTLLAFFVSRVSLAPIERISEQLDRISAGQFDSEPAVPQGDELGAVSTKISGIGRQLRDVQEVFSTLRENLDQVMSGIEDGLILFNAEGRTVLVSPSVEKFLGGPVGKMSGTRASEIFPTGHPLRSGVQINGDEIEQVEWAELILH
jgi:methyl-accepting chemotaxis protein